MQITKKKLSLLKPVRLKLDVPLTGPHTRLLRRPAPEVEALGSGDCIGFLRTSRLGQVLPLLPADIACYYGNKGGLQARDFRDWKWAEDILDRLEERPELRYLAVPVGHVNLPNEPWISRLATRLTPWGEEAIGSWLERLKRGIWFNFVRIYRFQSKRIEQLPAASLQPRVAPFRISKVEPVLADDVFAEKLEENLEILRMENDRSAVAYTRQVEAVSEEEKGASDILEKQPAYTLAQLVDECGFDATLLEEWLHILARKRQVVLYGPPGTGKTFLAERLGRCLVGDGGGFVDRVQFHASYAYEDFVQGIRPLNRSGGIVYELVPGRFVEFCKRAEALPDSPCALLIDEINRAPLARVFGELMYLLEYRQQEIHLAAGGAPFRIPHNAHLIGTMNTADRSIALVDMALRRRFAFIRVRPSLSVLEGFLAERGYPTAGLTKILEEINRQIGDPDQELGISYFMSTGEDLRATLRLIWKGEIEPYLEELFFDQPDKVERFRWEQLLVSGELDEWR